MSTRNLTVVRLRAYVNGLRIFSVLELLSGAALSNTERHFTGTESNFSFYFGLKKAQAVFLSM